MCATGLGQYTGVGGMLLGWVLPMVALTVLPWWFVPLLLGGTVALTVIHDQSE
jgi:hypothetical protein